MVITARVGTPVAEIAAVAADKKQCLGFDPADWGPLYGAPAQAATIGGVLAADASGSARLRNGAARDHLLGFRAVNGLGALYRAGGRVVKNVTGFDVPKLFCGAFGTLGPMVEVTLRLLPRAPQSSTLLLPDIDGTAGLALLRRAWTSPLEPSGLAYVPAGMLDALGDVGRGACLFRLDGATTPLADKIAALTSLLDAGMPALPDDGDALFGAIGDGTPFVDSTADLWRLFVPPSSSAAALDELEPSRWLADWAGGAIWLEFDCRYSRRGTSFRRPCDANADWRGGEFSGAAAGTACGIDAADEGGFRSVLPVQSRPHL